MYHLRRHLQLIKSNHKPLLHVTVHEFESQLHYSREFNFILYRTYWMYDSIKQSATPITNYFFVREMTMKKYFPFSIKRCLAR